MDQQLTENLHLSNEDKLSIIQQLHSKFKTRTTLPYEYKSQYINDPSQKIQYVYKTHNTNIIKRVTPQIITQKQQDYLLQHHQGTQCEQDERDNYRYFHDDLTCSKCAQFGHDKVMCPFQSKCLLCLSTSHKSDKCPQKNVCFRCYKFGHAMAQCSIRQHYQHCLKCQRNHDSKCNFLTRGKDRGKKMFNMDSLYSNPSIKCMKCGYFGHFICKA